MNGWWIPHSGRAAALMIVALILAVSIPVLVASVIISHAQAERIIEAQIGACARVTADRVDDARAWARRGDNRTARDLRSRVYLCEPLIRDGQHIIDKVLLAEAQGKP